VTGRSHRIELGERKIGRIAVSGESLLIPNVTGAEDWVADPEWIRTEQIRSFAGHPLIFRGETLGVLAVFCRTPLSDEDFKWLRTFADHAAVAIANAKAFEEIDRLRGQLQAENDYLHEEMAALESGEIVGRSPGLRKVLEQVALVAPTTATVLITGESGTGKELVARAIHERSSCSSRPLVKVNCGAIPEALFESEFFGHVKGAFTGAIKDRVGRFELADTGSIFLDEVAEIPLALQAKLLRVLQDKQFERVGDARTRTVDVRVIAATNRDLQQHVDKARFREDLLYRLTVFPIELPPLRERKEDIPELASHFLRKSAAKLGGKVPRLSQENARELQTYDWPGNIRELENVIERASILFQRAGQLSFDLKPPKRRTQPAAETSETSEDKQVLTKSQLRQREADNIQAALRQANGKVFGRGGAAEILGMRPTTLASRLKVLGLKKTYIASPPDAS
jgi:transcriptional regulator with GAF, ATPase, and Fis domain